ncbi:MAG: hypothetical protein A2092_10625 [Rhodobacteraceae bacterium GWE1_64_9]|nr:MAG: hypothetical protein A2092_10625 [Rhodobacteraceae bacterium GWE1_64_9]OHC49364.1 MAG: hypothetical protein A2X69_13580 [Rhodobacteraceae bacterium GWF1_65_7]HBD89985.1 hypothetical protein [Gemmobacter sp.]HBU15318.1 hypothetical protein [Gemmobacter sp.]
MIILIFVFISISDDFVLKVWNIEGPNLFKPLCCSNFCILACFVIGGSSIFKVCALPKFM